MRSSNATLSDIARAARVSSVTVSKVLNNQPGASAATRQRVREIAEQLGYIPNLSARGLASSRTNLVGFVTHDFTVQYATEITRGMADALAHAELEMLISITHQDENRERKRVQFLAQGLADGILLLAPRMEADLAQWLNDKKIPVVVVDPQRFDILLPTVSVQNYEGMRSAAQHLIELGHRRIGFIQGHPNFESSTERYRGYHDALLVAGVKFHDKLVRPGNYTQRRGFEAAKELLNLPSPPTAILATADVVAFGAIDAIRERKLRIPEDISVVGYDDVPQASQVYPPLTTVRQPLYEMGRTAVKLLLGLIRGEEPGNARVVLPTELVVRARPLSTAPIQTVLTSRAGSNSRGNLSIPPSQH